MLYEPDPWAVHDRMQRRRQAAARYRAARPLRAAAARRRREHAAAARRNVGFWLVEVGLRLVAPARQGPDVSSRLRRSL